jgi:hypothetical protein
MLFQWKKPKAMLNCVHGVGTIYRMAHNPAARLNDYRRQQFKEPRFRMLVVRQWKVDRELPEYAFNVGMAAFTDELFIHTLKPRFNKDFWTKAGVRSNAAFFNDYSTTLVTDEQLANIRILVLNALKQREFVDEQVNFIWYLLLTYTLF